MSNPSRPANENDFSQEPKPVADFQIRHPASHTGGAETGKAAHAQALYKSLFEMMPGSVVLLDAECRILDANPAFCGQIGYARDQLLGHHVSMFSQDSRETIERNLARLMTGKVLEHDVVNVHKDGSLRHYELREKAITLPDGARGILALSNDITQRVNAEKEKLELQRQFLHAEKLRSLGLMAGGIAHDFNNLLAAISGNIELAILDSGAKPAAAGPLREALAATGRAAQLIRQMLAYSGRGPFVATDLDLNQIISNMAELLKLKISPNANVELQLDKSLPHVDGDEAQLQLVLMNLVTNAAEALADKPGVITIATGVRDCDDTCLAANRTGNPLKPGRYIELKVSDTGCGMDEMVLQRLFDPFFTTKFIGRGLGMSAALGVMRGHNGGILVSSRVGQGTTMRALFPLGSTRKFNSPPLPGASRV